MLSSAPALYGYNVWGAGAGAGGSLWGTHVVQGGRPRRGGGSAENCMWKPSQGDVWRSGVGLTACCYEFEDERVRMGLGSGQVGCEGEKSASGCWRGAEIVSYRIEGYLQAEKT